jgi:hypothetical protein
MPICANDRPTQLAAGAILNFLAIGAATIARVRTASEKCSRNGFFRVTAASIHCRARLQRRRPAEQRFGLQRTPTAALVARQPAMVVR